MRWRTRSDAGSATLWVLACCALLALGGLGAVLTGGLAVARHRTAAAADLAALAAAGGVARDEPYPCRLAAQVAAASGVVLEGCRVDAGRRQATVRVSLPPAAGRPPWWPAWLSTGSVSARAGPTAGGRAGVPHRPCRAGRCRCRTWATARRTGSRSRSRSRRSRPGWRRASRRRRVEAALGEAGAAGVAVVDEDGRQAGVRVQRGRDAADVPAVAGGDERQQADRGVLGGVRGPGHVGRVRRPASPAAPAETVHQTAAVRRCRGRQVERLLAEHLAGGEPAPLVGRRPGWSPRPSPRNSPTAPSVDVARSSPTTRTSVTSRAMRGPVRRPRRARARTPSSRSRSSTTYVTPWCT